MAGGSTPAKPAQLPSVAQGADGSLTIGLFLPFESAGVARDHVRLAPFGFGHLIRWQGGRFTSAMELLLELSGWKTHEIERLNRIDYPRVMKAFMDHVDEEVAADLAAGRVPMATDAVYSRQTGAVAAEAPPPAPFPDPEPAAAPGAPMDDPWAGVEDQARPIDYDPRVDD